MCLTEFNEAETFQALADDYRAEGYAEGYAEEYLKGKVEALAEVLEDGILSVKQAAERVNMTVPAFKKMAAELKKQKVEV